MEPDLEKVFFRSSEINRENLIKLLRDNSGTEYGLRYRFGEIQDVNDYRKKIPLSDYEAFLPYIERMRRGEADKLTIYPIKSFCRTSGTVKEPKYIPLTEEALRRYAGLSERFNAEILRKYGGKRLMVSTFYTDLSRPIENTLLLSEIYYRYLLEEGLFDADTLAGGRELCFSAETGDMFFAKAWVSLLSEDIVILESIYMYETLCFFSYMDKNWRKVISSIKQHRIPREVTLPGRIKELLLNMPVSAERLAQAERELEKGSESIAERLWPGLRLVSGISNKAFSVENAALERYTGKIPRHYLWYSASECVMGIPVGECDYRFVLLPESGFYEFIPLEEEEEERETSEAGQKTLLPEELEIGKSYEIVVTNFSGLYRYRMGDILKVAGFYGESPVVEFAFRKDMALNVAGEKLGIRQIEYTMDLLSEELPEGCSVEAYCFGTSAEFMPERYIALVSSEYTGEQREHSLSIRLDGLLKSVSRDYRELREMDYIGSLSAYIFSPSDYRDFLSFIGLTGGHNKPKHIFKSDVSGKVIEKWRVDHRKEKENNEW